MVFWVDCVRDNKWVLFVFTTVYYYMDSNKNFDNYSKKLQINDGTQKSLSTNLFHTNP